MLVDGGVPAGVFDAVGLAQREQPLANVSQFIPVHILEGELVAEAEDFAIDKEAVVAAIVLDGVIVPEAEDFLSHLVAHDSPACTPKWAKCDMRGDNCSRGCSQGRGCRAKIGALEMDSNGPISQIPWHIRSFRREDLPACTQLYRDGLLGGKIAENDTGLDIDDIEQAYMSKPGSHFWVAELLDDSHEIVGMIGVQQDEDSVGEIRRLRVKVTRAAAAIGSALIETALKFCQERGYLKIKLDTFVDREPAIKLFEKFHFRHSRTRNLHDKEIMHFYLDLYQRDEHGGRQQQMGA